MNIIESHEYSYLSYTNQFALVIQYLWRNKKFLLGLVNIDAVLLKPIVGMVSSSSMWVCVVRDETCLLHTNIDLNH